MTSLETGLGDRMETEVLLQDRREMQEKKRDRAEMVEDVEDSERINNLRIRNLPEEVEKEDPMSFLKQAICTFLDPGADQEIEIDRTHRVCSPA